MDSPSLLSNEEANLLFDFMNEWQASDDASTVSSTSYSASQEQTNVIKTEESMNNHQQERNPKPAAKKTTNKKIRIAKKKSKSKSKSGADEPPKRPLLAYNIYFQYERQRILNEIDHLPPSDVNACLVMKIANDYKARPKRKHRKSHGKISFLTLSKTVAHRWKLLDPFVKKHFEKQGKIEAYLYEQRYKQWLQDQENKKKKNRCGENDDNDADDDGGADNQQEGIPIVTTSTNEEQEKKDEDSIADQSSSTEMELSVSTPKSKQNLKGTLIHGDALLASVYKGEIHTSSSTLLIQEPLVELEEFPSQTTMHFCPLLAQAKQDGYNLFQDVAGSKTSDFF